MTAKQKIELRMSELRSKINTILAKPERTDEDRAELTKHTEELGRQEVELRAAIAASPGESGTAISREDSEARELRELTERANAGDVFVSALEHRATDGATKELQDHFKVGPNQLPLSMLEQRGSPEVEHRAITAAPANVGQNQSAIIPAVFPLGAAAFLGIDMPRVPTGESVFPVMTKKATVHTPAESGAAAETTGTFDAEVLSPGRLQASFFYSREDRARFQGLDGSLRQNLGEALSDGLDKSVIAGTDGLLTGTNLANHAAGAVTSFAKYLADLAYGRVDGSYAATARDLRVVVGSGTYAHAGSVYRNNNVDRTALDRLMEVLGGVRVSAHVPAVSGNKQNAIVRLGMRRDAVCAIWEGVTIIPDEVTKASTGEIVITAVLLCATKILRSGGFHKQEVQTA